MKGVFDVKNEVKKSSLATASLVLGIIGVVLSFIPIINNAAFILGILAIIFGIVTLVKKTGKGKSISGLVLGIFAVIIALAMQSAFSDALDDTSKDLNKATGDATEEVLKNDVDVKLGKFKVTTNELGIDETKLVVSVKNLTNEKKSFSIHIEAVDSTGKRIEDDYVYADDLAAGQRQNFNIFTLITDEKLSAMKKATFKIVDASVY